MAKDPWKNSADEYGNRPDESWAGNMPKFKDPISGKTVKQTPEGNPYPIGGRVKSDD